MHPLILSALVVMANVLGVGMIVPQATRLLGRNGSANGVSGTWIGIGISLNSWWVAYALRSDLPGLLPVSLGAAALYLVMAVGLHRHNGTSAIRSVAAGVLLLGSAPVPFLLADGWSAAGLAIGACYCLQFAPAAAAAVRSSDVSGISPTTWVMALVEAAIWWGYGLSADDRALVVGGAGASVCSLIILARLLGGTRRRRWMVGRAAPVPAGTV
ncbi:MAG: hypothetical protein AAGA65_31145 [Actinomycetota bacterium]